MSFNPTDAAFEGIRLARRHPRSILIWSALMLVFSLGSSLLMLSGFAPLFAELETIDPSTDPEAAMAIMGQLIPFYLIATPAFIVFFGIFYTAVYRAVLRPADKAWGHLRLGGDELRMMGLFVYQMAVWLGLTLVAGIVFGLLVAVGIVSGMGGEGIGTAAAAIAALILYFVYIGVAIWLAVRLSLSQPMTFEKKRIVLFKSWSMTKGRFWPLLGCYLLALVTGLVVSLLGGAIGMAMLVAFGEFTDFASMMEPNLTSIQAYLTPGRIAMLVVNSVISTLAYAIFLAPAAAAYRDINGLDTGE